MPLNRKPAVEDLAQKRPIAKSVVFGFFFYGFLAGLGLLVIIGLGWYFLTTPSSQEIPVQSEAQPPPAPPGMTSAESPANLRLSLEEVFAQVRVANQTKDLSLFLKAYSPNFPQLSQKAQEITRIWQAYDYLAMEYTILEMTPLPDNRVLARVTWNIETRDRHTKARKKLTRTYLTWFAREAGHWHIVALEKVS